MVTEGHRKHKWAHCVWEGNSFIPPNDASSYDHIRLQCVLAFSWLTGSAHYKNSTADRTPERAHGKRSIQQHNVTCYLLFYWWGEEAGESKPPLSLWIQLHRTTTGLASECTCMILTASSGCQRDTRKRGALKCDGFDVINEMNPKGTATWSDKGCWYELTPHSAMSLSAPHIGQISK